jgi:AcrR family transcriptional regulator
MGIIVERVTGGARRRGRPSEADAAALEGAILRAAMRLFLDAGYGATTMEAVAAAAGVTKRTLYGRYPQKAALFAAAVGALIAAWRTPFDAALAAEAGLAETLERAGVLMLRAALAPEALALYRLIVAESARFAEIGPGLATAGSNTGIERIALLLTKHGVAEPVWAAEQFQRMVIGGPQVRALGLGVPLSEAELGVWVSATVQLFLAGVSGGV